MARPEISDLLSSVLGKTLDDPLYKGKTIYSRAYAGEKQIKGKITRTEPCTDSGCSGIFLYVLWDDGKQTIMCTTQCTWRDKQTLEIT